MLQNLNFPRLRPGPRWGSLQRSPDSLADGEGLAAPSQETHPAVGLGPRFYGSQGVVKFRVM